MLVFRLTLLFMVVGAQRQPKVCQSVDVRNSVESFANLRDCEVVEGFVQILLLDRANETSFANISFPKLREISGYLLLFRVNGLRTLGDLFPNLSVIRGNTLFLNYALVAFEMMHLQELGLRSLTTILRGGVRLEKNPLLCYTHTVDWNRILVEGKDELHISANRRKNDCPLSCPKNCTGGDLCWNSKYCQKICDKCKGACDANGNCCHMSCLGGCSVPDSIRHCDVCRDVSYQGQCLEKCPVKTYKYQNRRCLTEEECRSSVDKPRDWAYAQPSRKWKPFDDTRVCLQDCPSLFTEVNDSNGLAYCKRCEGTCRKECSGANVDSIASAQRLRGCTYIRGALEIQIRGGKNMVKELEENLNMIEEIEGFLKIVRSFPLVSLNFLKRLRVIKGNILESGKYALIALDNQNLQELWDWDTREENLQIKGDGKLFFHFNPKLCMNKIEKLRQVANMSKFSDLEVAPSSNGDKVACNMSDLEVNITKRFSTGAILAWRQFDHYDPRSLLGYIVYLTEAPYKNVTLYDGRDACGGDGWRVDDVAYEPSQPEISHILTYLKPYTQYAFYVKTYTIATERTGAQSSIQYFVTYPDVPSKPPNLKCSSNSSSEIVLEWKLPLTPNGNVTYYIVVGEWIKDDPQILEKRNYCSDPLSSEKPTVPPPILEKPSFEVDERRKSCCACSDASQDPDNKRKENEVQSQIDFEDALQNYLYVKRNERRKRSISGVEKYLDSQNMYSAKDMGRLGDENKEPDRREGQIILNVTSTTAVISQLHHFAEYRISVRACRELEEGESQNTTNCSDWSIDTVRTLRKVGADDINIANVTVEVLNQTSGSVKLKWAEPVNPNGMIVTYQVEYKREDIVNYKAQEECIVRNVYLADGHSYTLSKLQPGNYSFRIRATSLYGEGSYTSRKYFYIQESTSSSLELVVGVLGGVIVFVLIVLGMVIYMRHKYVSTLPSMLIASVNPEYVQTMYVPDEWEVPREKIKLLRELGQGSFGMVWEGVYYHKNGEEKPCAVKTVNEHATDRERSEFLNEASVMKAFNTHHVVQLLGVVSEGQPVLVIMELMSNGDLKTYLRSHRPDVSVDPTRQPPTLKRILQMAIEIADGMAYLSAKKFVHRDLAARNCMVAEDMTVKIGDFGMTRDIYETDYYRKGTKGLLPVRWMAPESLKDGVFTSHSDVWSYGVVLWEMATLASQPYQGLSNDQVLRYVIDGGVMERPENCPDRLYELMRVCWEYKPSDRPPFVTLVSLLLPDVSPSFTSVSFYHSGEGCELRAHQAEVSAAEDDPTTPLRGEEPLIGARVGNGSANGWLQPVTRTTEC